MRGIRMSRKVGAVAGTAAVGLALAAAPAMASPLHFANCTALTRVYHHGVSKSRAAAQKQVKAGYGMPAFDSRAQKVYWANYRSMDRDRDGTACER